MEIQKVIVVKTEVVTIQAVVVKLKIEANLTVAVTNLMSNQR